LTPEARARQSIDALLVAAGWAVRDLKHARHAGIAAKGDRRRSIIREIKSEGDVRNDVFGNSLK
jgi:hypothetical protein